MRNAPIVDTRLSAAQPGRSGYVKTRRGMPRMPRKCWTKNVMLKPMTMSQKFALPRRSESIRPLIFGNQ